MSEKDIAVEDGSGNVFADLGLPNAGLEQVKAQLTLVISTILRERGYTQTRAAKVLGLHQPQVSALKNNRPGRFALGSLLELLNRLDSDVEITVKPRRTGQAKTSVTVR